MADGAAGASGAAQGAATAATSGGAQASPDVQTTQGENGASAAGEKNEEKKTLKGKQRLLERYAKQYPDRKFAEDSEDDDLYSLTADEFDKYDNERKEYTEKHDQLNKLFDDFPDSGEIFRAMAIDKTHPFDYIIDHYGDILEDGLQSDESRERMKKRREEKAQRDADFKAADEKYTENIRNTMKTLEGWGKKRGLDDKAQAEHFMKIRQALNDFADGNISEETFDLFYNGSNYGNDVEKARQEGEVNGRNAKIETEFQRSRRHAMPPTLGGQGGGSEEYDEESKGDILPIFGIPIKQKKK